MAEQVTQEDPWQEWGLIYDRDTTVAVITSLQSDGWKVRVVKEGERNRVYVQKRSAA